jgi:hypothetical protein
MIGVLKGVRFRECHVESNAGDNGLPRLISRQTPSFDRAPKADYFLFRDAVEKIVIASFVKSRIGVYALHV